MQPIDEQTGGFRASFDSRARPAPPALVFDMLEANPLAGAWRRWFARSFDVWWQTGLVALVSGSILGHTSPAFLHWLETPFGWKLFGLACVPAALVLDAFMAALAGNTPGKALLGLRVVNVDERAPDFIELLGRNLGLWRAGLGLGLPVVSLFTMARQAMRLRKGLSASYDGKLFEVRVQPVGWCRKTVFAGLFAALLVLIVSLDSADRQDSREMAAMMAAPPTSWTNPATGRSVNIAAQWKVEEIADADGALQHRFTQHSGHAVVLFTLDEHADTSLRHHVRALAGGFADGFELPGGYFKEYRGKPSWIAAGEEKYGPARVHLRVVQVDGQAWRVMVTQVPPEAYTDDLVQELTESLWDSVTPP